MKAREPAAAPEMPYVPATLATARTCRVLALEGKATDEHGVAVERGAPLDGKAWLDLPGGASLTVKYTSSGRELTFAGPAHFLPCDRGEERHVVTRGRVTTTTWAGARPGVEVLVATPFGLVRYGDARLEVTVDDAKLTVRALSGDAWIADTLVDSPDRKVAAGAPDAKVLLAKEPGGAVADCELGAKAAEERARSVLSGGTAAPLGELAAAHVRARRKATAACAIAEAALGRAAAGAERDQLAVRVARAEERYRTLPSLLPTGK